MKEHIEQIRTLLNTIEGECTSIPESKNGSEFSAYELPLVIQEIVDDLQPLLTTYEAAFYWYAFRHSIARNGKPHLRLNTKGMRSGVVRSSYSTAVDNTISEGKMREIYRALESIGAIRKVGEPNRHGTLYQVFIPDEIEACRKFRAEREAAKPQPDVKDSEIDFYNIRENRIKVYERDEYKCRYCQKQLTRFTTTLDDMKPVAEGGDNSFENLLTACFGCNSRKNNRPVGDFLAESTS
jgi:HNH endonuclease